MSTYLPPRVTTVVMTRNRWEDLAATLARHDLPVIVVDNGSVDGTPDRLRRHFPDVDVVRLRNNEGAVARNHGVEAASTPFVAFADDDSWWDPGAADRAVELFDAYPRLGLIAGRVMVGEGGREDPVSTAMATSPLPRDDELPGVPVLGFVACGAIVRREAFLDAGGFDPVVHWPGEEERLALDLAAAGWALQYVKEITARHHPAQHRDPPVRRLVLERRNALLTAVMRRPWPVVGQQATRLLSGDRVDRSALVHAVRRLPGALGRRRLLPPEVEEERRLLDAFGGL